ncbi:alpha-2-macroglobulin-P-like [Acanthopagrus latus]|uniref:alpha-2-macroglobulin-P-like n=1 Tax=Acanthopagrus latus TaxID=8177 RepID=UPI00187C4CB5|nr:alpha-2-macroglobulin-P-like [Acanthopagrus latus]
MDLPELQTRTWTLFVCISCMFVAPVVARPQYMVATPAVIEAGAQTKFCASLLQPSETLVMTVTLISQEKRTILFEETTSTEFHTCVQFQAPFVQEDEVQNFKVEVQGATFHSEEVRKVMIKIYQPVTFIQTDKPIYLPGQTVHFRVIALDTKFRPVSTLFNVIEIQDANHNRIGQWLNITSNGKILQLSHPLNSEAHEGTYRVTLWMNRKKIEQNFKVEKYVLPKFNVKINVADEISAGQDEIKVEVCAKYTYGQPVPGTVELVMCRPSSNFYSLNPDPRAPCYQGTKQTEKNGCAMFVTEMSTFTNVGTSLLHDELRLVASGTEEGTGISFLQGKKVKLSPFFGLLSFIDTPKIYDQALILEGKVKAVYFNNTPIPDKLVHLSLDAMSSSRLLQNLTTDSDGVAAFSLNTTSFKGNILLLASLAQTPEPSHVTRHYETARHTLSMVQPPAPHIKSVSFLEVKGKDVPLPCEKEEIISIQYTIVGETQGSVDIMYLILSRGAIVTQGLKKVDVQNSHVTEGEVSFTLKASPEIAPVVQVVAYTVLPSETVIAHSADFSTEKCFSNKVSVEFSPSSAVPGEEATLQVTAQPDSLCGVSIVDLSVLIKEPGKTLDKDKIFDLLPVKKASSFPHDLEDPVPCLNVRQRRYIRPDHDDNSAYGVFMKLGLKMATNLLFRMPSCVNFKGTEYYVNRLYFKEPRVMYMTTSSLGGPPPFVTVRSFFPETWIWNLVEVGESGTKDVSLTVPDTITTWETEAFCLSPQGFGLAPRKQFTVFQPFFLELSLPYSIIRGEHFELKATTFNYLSSCIMVTVTLAPSLDYTVTPLSGNQYTSCLCANQRKTLSWAMIPSVLGVVNVSVTAEAVASHMSCDNEIVSVPERGRIDVVTRPLIVKAEGSEMTKAYNWLLCPKGEALTEEIELLLPENVIDGSARATLSVLGDILGRALKNLDGLLKMPYGCGEQNMALLAPNIYILQYLKNTQQLTTTIKEKATNFLTSGYQRQLNYKHYYGAYSTFGTGVGNTWLTAFVLRSFVKAQSFVYIDPEKIQQTKDWLESKQQENGCFEQSGTLFNNRMKGGVSDEVTLSAYITAAFLEMNISVTHHAVNRSLSCLNESISDLNNTYTTALLAYVFTLAGDMETRAHLLEQLDKVALNQGGFLHWSQTATETSASLSVEISSYVLLAKLSASPTAEDLAYAHRIVRWLTGQQNQYGGFSSTQDTVVALQALALYSTLVFSLEGSSTVTVQSSSGQLTFDVNQDNKLLYQEEVLKDVTGKYSLEVKGTACASMQISLHYNIPTPADVTTLSVEVKPVMSCISQRPKLTLELTSLYSGEQTSTNMVILDIKMLSGFVPHPQSLQMLRGALPVARIEQNTDHVLVYLQGLPKDIPTNHSLQLVQEHPVQNLKPAVVKIYDYYQPSDQAETDYIFSCAAA